MSHPFQSKRASTVEHSRVNRLYGGSVKSGGIVVTHPKKTGLKRGGAAKRAGGMVMAGNKAKTRADRPHRSNGGEIEKAPVTMRVLETGASGAQLAGQQRKAREQREPLMQRGGKIKKQFGGGVYDLHAAERAAAVRGAGNPASGGGGGGTPNRQAMASAPSVNIAAMPDRGAMLSARNQTTGDGRAGIMSLGGLRLDQMTPANRAAVEAALTRGMLGSSSGSQIGPQPFGTASIGGMDANPGLGNAPVTAEGAMMADAINANADALGGNFSDNPAHGVMGPDSPAPGPQGPSGFDGSGVQGDSEGVGGIGSGTSDSGTAEGSSADSPGDDRYGGRVTGKRRKGKR